MASATGGKDRTSNSTIASATSQRANRDQPNKASMAAKTSATASDAGGRTNSMSVLRRAKVLIAGTIPANKKAGPAHAEARLNSTLGSGLDGFLEILGDAEGDL